MSSRVRGIFCVGVCLFFTVAARAETPVDGVASIRLSFPSATTDGRLMQQPGLTPGTVEYSIVTTQGLTVNLTATDARDLLASVNNLARTGRTYQVARTTEGYSPGTVLGLELTIVREGAAFRPARYSDQAPSRSERLAPEFANANPIYLGARFSFQDAARVGGDPHAAIQLSEEGAITYHSYSKTVNVHETVHQRADGGITVNTHRPTVPGMFPSVEMALAAARPPAGDVSGLRFAADFGPQFNGAASSGTKRANQLMPIIPIGMVQAADGRRFVAALPPDRLQAYRRGEVPREEILVIPPGALRFVHAQQDWQRIVDDYFELRSTGRDSTRIFVANFRPANNAGPGALQTMTSGSMVGEGPPREQLNRTIDGLRPNVSDSILRWERPRRPNPPPPDDCAGGLGSAAPPPA